jgi:hypothetical protein
MTGTDESKKLGKIDGTGGSIIAEVLAYAEPRPLASEKDQSKKTAYSIRFAEKMGEAIARDLRPKLKGITATTKRESPSAGGKKKQLDVNFSTVNHGLAVGISLKSVHLGDIKNGRYTHNMKRNEEELRIEASGYHKRQPYAVMVAVLFVPFDSCDDGKGENPSSFGSWVRHLRPFCGRRLPTDDVDRFERIFVGLYEVDGSDLRFFDVECAPPKRGRPATTGDALGPDKIPRRVLAYPEFLDAVHHEYLQRNSAEFQWADGDEEPLEADEIDSLEGTEGER